MKFTIKWILFITVLVFSLNATSQNDIAFQQLSKKDGLSQSSVFSIAQDSLGFMWFGTRDGLNRFDGYHFKIYQKDTSQNSIVGNDVRVIYVSPTSKDIWIGTTSGLSRHRSSTDDFQNYHYDKTDLTTLSGKVIRSIFQDSKNQLWVGTSQGLNLYNPNTDNFSRIDFPNLPPNHNVEISSIIEDKNGILWLGTDIGLFTIKKVNSKFEIISIALPNIEITPNIKVLTSDKSSNLWIGTEKHGLYYWNQENQLIVSYQNEALNPNSITHNEIRSLCLDENENLWIATFNGLSYLKKGTSKFLNYSKSEKQTGLSHNSVHSVFIDNQNSLWVGTYYGGVNHWAKNYNRFRNFRHSANDNSLSNDVVSSFTEDENGNLWIGTEGGGLNFMDKNGKFIAFKNHPNKNSICGNNVKKIILDKEKIWIGTFHKGLDLFDIQSKQFTHFVHRFDDSNSLSNNNVYGLLKDHNNLWILTYGGGLDILNLNTNTYTHFKNKVSDTTSLSSNLSRVIIKTEKSFWIGTEKGLNKVNCDRNGLPISFETFLNQQKIYSLYFNNKNVLWIGTFGNGLYRMDLQSNEINHFGQKDGLPGNSIFGILEDENNKIWLSTNNGLSKLDPLSHSFTNYNHSNGLINLEYNFNAYFKLKNGEMLFGGTKGFTQFHPKSIHLNTFTPPLVLTEFKKNNKTVKLKNNLNEISEMEFDYNEANFSMKFAALDFVSPENNRYAYKLEGLDKEWNYATGKTEAVYRIQKEGSYLFKLRGTNSDGIWNPDTKLIKIIVRPPWWKTWWAYIAYSLLILLLAIGFYRFITLKHNLELQKNIKLQADILNEEKLTFFTNITHEFRTPLTLIIGPLKEIVNHEQLTSTLNKKIELIEKNANRLLNLVNQILTFRKLETDHEPMQISKHDLIPFLKEIFLLFQGKANLHDIRYTFHTDQDSIDLWFDDTKLERVFFNLLSNAFKFTPDRGKIELTVKVHAENIEIQVSDNGPGIDPKIQNLIFKRFYERSNNERFSVKNTGIGLAISKQMIDLHQGNISVQSTKDQESGATFIVKLKKGNAHFDESTIIESNILPEIKHETNNEKENNPVLTDDSPRLLIVEDNPEVLNYIERIFSKIYIIQKATNGIEGLDKASQFKPNLIISDIMMPEMDGITFCAKLKSNIEISHIPIILLSARTTSNFIIEGLQNGADDYITKPFNPDELKLRVRNIIQTRLDIQNKFSRSISFDPKKINITSTDEIFLENALTIVENNMGNFQFNVLQFAKELAVSRPLLFTKIKALTGQTPNNFIKTIRLKRAAQLLKSNKLNISEVANMVSFKDPKYFRKCFQQQFEQTPSEYKKRYNS